MRGGSPENLGRVPGPAGKLNAGKWSELEMGAVNLKERKRKAAEAARAAKLAPQLEAEAAEAVEAPAAAAGPADQPTGVEVGPAAAAAAAAAGEDDEIRVGATVIVSGLTKATEHNGAQGVVVKFDRKKQRCGTPQHGL